MLKFPILEFSSVYLSSSFDWNARYRYFKHYYLDHHKEKPIDALEDRNFFCTYLVGYCLQTAESRKVMPQVVSDPDAAPPKTRFKLLNWLLRGLWTHSQIPWIWKKMSEKIKLQFDAKRLTPMDFRNFIVRKPEVFRDVFLLRAEDMPGLLKEKNP